MSSIVKRLTMLAAIVASAYGTTLPTCEIRSLAHGREKHGKIFFAQQETPDLITDVKTLWSAQIYGLGNLDELLIKAGSMTTNPYHYVTPTISSVVTSKNGEFDTTGSGVHSVEMFPL